MFERSRYFLQGEQVTIATLELPTVGEFRDNIESQISSDITAFVLVAAGCSTAFWLVRKLSGG